LGEKKEREQWNNVRKKRKGFDAAIFKGRLRAKILDATESNVSSHHVKCGLS